VVIFPAGRNSRYTYARNFKFSMNEVQSSKNNMLPLLPNYVITKCKKWKKSVKTNGTLKSASFERKKRKDILICNRIESEIYSSFIAAEASAVSVR